MKASWLKRGLKLAAALGMAAALSGCVVYPYGGFGYGYGPRHYGYYHPHPYGYY